MSVILDGTNLTVENLVKIARLKEKIEVSNEAIQRIKTCRAMLEKKFKHMK